MIFLILSVIVFILVSVGEYKYREKGQNFSWATPVTGLTLFVIAYYLVFLVVGTFTSNIVITKHTHKVAHSKFYDGYTHNGYAVTHICEDGEVFNDEIRLFKGDNINLKVYFDKSIDDSTLEFNTRDLEKSSFFNLFSFKTVNGVWFWDDDREYKRDIVMHTNRI